ncbi:MAG TPA: pyridoxamine 5'-phosphate oxidase [Tepidisphaeraceae bacterium]|jgi:pyridoxamine 5'-phosphate oxidase
MSERPLQSFPDLSRLRLEYQQRSLSETDVDPDPLRQFVAWFQEALMAKAHEPNAMTLATSTGDGVPSARIVLLKGVDQKRFVFFTNYLSRKGRELDQNPRAALVFYWPELERQVRVEGDVERTSAAESDAYFASRPPASRIGSAASDQSQPIASRDVLEARVKELRAQFPNGDIPRPAEWGGYRLRPRRVEFWQGRPSRLHDRIEYLRDASSSKWIVRRLAP